MKPEDRARYRAKLLALKEEIARQGNLTIEPARKDPTEVGGDEDEQPLTEMSQVIASKRNHARTAVLHRVVKALEQLETDPETFGLCQNCEEPIGRRLEAMPYVELCLECQSEQDERPGTHRRRHLTDYR